MKRLATLTLLLAAISQASASTPQEWDFVYVSRSSSLVVVEGKGSLVRDGSHLTGTLTGPDDVQFKIDVKLTSGKANAEFGSTESDDGGTRMKGTFRQSTIPGTGCWQTINVSDGFSSVVLARAVAICES